MHAPGQAPSGALHGLHLQANHTFSGQRLFIRSPFFQEPNSQGGEAGHVQGNQAASSPHQPEAMNGKLLLTSLPRQPESCSDPASQRGLSRRFQWPPYDQSPHCY